MQDQERGRALSADLTDLRFYLERTFPEQTPIHLLVHRHYGSGAGEIAYLVVMVDVPEERRRIRARGEAALRSIGYSICPRPGADVYDVLPSSEAISAHRAVRIMARFRDVT